jgi:hypothetical protein
MVLIRSVVSRLTSGLLRSARETVEWDTFAALAMSLMDAGFSIDANFGARLWSSNVSMPVTVPPIP